MTHKGVISHLKEQLSEALEQLSVLQTENRALQEQLVVAHQRIAELEKQKTRPPAFVKANVKKPKGEPNPRKQRGPRYNHARRRGAPTRIVEHPLKHCPVCRSAPGGIGVETPAASA